MKHGDQIKIAQTAQKSTPFISRILSGKARPSWQTAKELASATGTSPILWVEGTSEEIRDVLSGRRPSNYIPPAAAELCACGQAA